MRNSIVDGENSVQEVPESGKEISGHVNYSVHERNIGEDPVRFTPLTITFSTAVRPVTTMPFKPSVAYATLAERK